MTAATNDWDQWIMEATIPHMQAAMTTGELTSCELVMLYLKRIAAIDSAGPKLNSVLEVNPDALHIAEALDAERKRKGVRGPLHGIPILIKDNLATCDKMHTSAGSLALAECYAAADAFVVKQLRQAGAVILGKTNLTEFANFMTENMPNGYSSRGGQVLNPYGPGRFDVGGSSSGSGAAIAANLAAAAIGTETSGSILSPASSNSLVGIKPTIGLASRSGIIPIAFSQDTAGPMARTVTDAALLLGAITGIDEEDPVTSASAGKAFRDYTSFLKRDGLRGTRIGVARPFYFDSLTPEKKRIMEEAIQTLRDLGAQVIDPVAIPSASETWDYNVLLYEFKPSLNAYLGKLPPAWPIRTLRDVIRFNEAHAEACLRYGQTILLQSEETSGTLTEPAYLESRARDLFLSRQQGIDCVMAEHKLDALLFPANYGASIAAKAGYPSITVPGGYTPEGEPLGITFTARAYEEPVLLRFAYAFEQATRHRVAPQLG